GVFDDGRIGRRRKVRFEHADFRRFLVGEIRATALRKLLDRILPLLDERADHLSRFAIVEGTSPIDLAIHQRRFEHAKRDEADLILTAHRIGDRRIEIVDESHQTELSVGRWYVRWRLDDDAWRDITPGSCRAAGLRRRLND